MRDVPWDQWLYVAAPFVVYFSIVVGLAMDGDHGDERNPLKIFFKRISSSLERHTGYPGWAAAGALSGLAMLATAAIGLYWDVAWHIDFGRDEALMTPSHTMILLGLGGIVYAAGVAITFATIDDAPVGLRVGRLRVPWTALAMAAMGAGGVAAFPLDNLWHEAYGIDVTLWSPTHLQLIAGGAIATIPVWLMLREGRPSAPTMLGRAIEVTALGAILTGVSAYQGEFDFGAPQFQVLYLPILIAFAAAFTLVLARIALGPWGALKAVVAFFAIRGTIAFLVTVPLNHTFPKFPLYLVSALAVEGVALLLGTGHRLRLGAVAGAAAGTVGVAADLGWLAALSDVTATARLLPTAALFSLVTGVAAGILGAALGRAVPEAEGSPTAFVHPAAALAAGLVALAAFAYPLPRNVGPVDTVIRLTPAAEAGRAGVEVELIPPDAADTATAFGILAWQGGGTVAASLDEVGPGRYVADKAIPITGSWKAMVGLQRGDEVMAAPIYLPADPEIGAPEIPAVAERRTSFVRNTELLLREQRSGPSDTAMLAYSGLAVVVLVWIGLFSVCASVIGRAAGEDAGPRAGSRAGGSHAPTSRATAWQPRDWSLAPSPSASGAGPAAEAAPPRAGSWYP